MGLVEVGTMLCVAGDFNAHVGVAETGDEESIGRYGWGTRNRGGQDLVEMVMRNGMVVAGSFFQKRDSHKVTYRSGNHKTELDLLVVRRQQLCTIKDCKAIAGEYVTTQHKPVVFIVRMQKTRKSRMQGRKTIKWWKCTEGMIDEYKERVKMKYEEPDTEVEAVEEEWKNYKDSFVGVAEEMCGRTSGKGGRSKNQEWWTDEVARAVDEKREVWKKIEMIRDRGEQASVAMKHLYGRKKKAARRAVDKAGQKMEEELYKKLGEDGGKRIIYKMAWDRNEESKDVKRGSVIQDKNGTLITDHNAVLHVWETYFKELLNKTEDSELELPSSIREKTEVVEITDTEMMAAMKKMKNGKATGLDEIRVEMLDLAGDVGVNWTRRLLNSCLTEGKVPVEWRTGLIIPIWKMKADVHDPEKYRGITLLSQVLKLLERVLDGRIRKKIECEIGEEQQGFRKRNHGWVVHTEAVRGEKTRKAREHVYWICRPGEGIRHSVKGNCDGNVVLAGSARSRGQDGGGNI